MRIERSSVDYSVRAAYSERREQSNSFQLDIRAAAQTQPSQLAPATIKTLSTGAAGGWPPATDSDPKLLLARLIVEQLLGGSFAQPGRVSANAVQVESRSASAAAQPATAQNASPRWSVTISHSEVYEESESLSVQATGAVRTADGADIQFDALFTLARSYREEAGLTVRAGNAGLSDPLFLDTPQGQALLINDSNRDNQATGDNELFGARTGDGFAELAQLDSDANGWIDEGDPVYGQLKLTFASGETRALAALGIGALSTTGAQGQFQYKNDSNELVALVRRTGVYLTESGTAGAMRQIDLVV
jgi:hypothetical protein